MAFSKEVQKPPASIGRLAIAVASQDAATPIEASVTFQVLDIDGKVIKSMKSELLQHITQPQRNQLAAFMTQLRNLATTEVI